METRTHFKKRTCPAQASHAGAEPKSHMSRKINIGDVLMKTLGNILWHVPFLGFLTALGTFLVGGLLVITVIGAPLGLGLIQLSKFLDRKCVV